MESIRANSCMVINALREERWLHTTVSGEPNIKTPGGMRTQFSTRQARPYRFRTAMLQKARELFHRKPGLSDQRSKSPFGQFLMVGNRKASVAVGRRV